MKLHRSVLRFSSEMRDQLDEQARMARVALRRDVSRSAVFRAAIRAWFEATKGADPVQVVEAIRVSLISRGRKRQR